MPPTATSQKNSTPQRMSISPAELAPLVAQIQEGYRCAQLLVRLPGHIPMPSFFAAAPLPSTAWVDVTTRHLKKDVLASLSALTVGAALVPAVGAAGMGASRAVWQAPLVVTPEGRARFLESIGVPREKHGAHVLVVSFVGQVFKRARAARAAAARIAKTSRGGSVHRTLSSGLLPV